MADAGFESIGFADCSSRGPQVGSVMRLKGLAQALSVGLLVAGPGVADTCAPYIEEHPTQATASFRPHTTASGRCEVSEAAYRQVVGDWLRRRPPEAPSVTSLSLGRAVAFPWISRHLAHTALQSPGWASRVAKVPAGQRDQLAAPVLRDPLLLQRLAAPFSGTRYTVLGISFEKVLFARADEHSSNPRAGAVKVPFDAQLWLRLASRR